MHLVAQVFQTFDERTLKMYAIILVKIVRAAFLVVRAISQYMVDDHQN